MKPKATTRWALFDGRGNLHEVGLAGETKKQLRKWVEVNGNDEWFERGYTIHRVRVEVIE